MSMSLLSNRQGAGMVVMADRKILMDDEWIDWTLTRQSLSPQQTTRICSTATTGKPFLCVWHMTMVMQYCL